MGVKATRMGGNRVADLECSSIVPGMGEYELVGVESSMGST